MKKQEQKAHAMGLDIPSAVRVFLCQMVRDRRLPFTPSLNNLSPLDIAKIKASFEQIAKGQGIEKTLDELRALEK